MSSALLVLALTRTAQGADPMPDSQTDLLAYSSPDQWFAGLKEADAQVAGLVRPELLALTPAESEEGTRPSLAAIRARAAALHWRERELHAARVALLERRAMLEERASLRSATSAMIQTRVDAAAASTEEALAQAKAELGQATPAARRALGQWAEVYRGMYWSQALASDSGVLPLARATNALREARAGLPDPVGGALDDLFSRCDAELTLRLEQRRFELSEDPSAKELEKVLEELATIDFALGGIAVELQQLRVEESTKSAQRSAPQAVLEENRALVQLGARYARLQDQLDRLPATIDSSQWCSLWIHGALVRLALDEPGADELLRRAATTREDACRPQVAPWLDIPLVQMAWADARFLANEGAQVTLILAATGGRWHVDGVPVLGSGDVTLTLRPGLHRVDREGNGGDVLSWMEELQPGERLGAWATPVEIEAAPLAPGSASARPVLPPHDRIVFLEERSAADSSESTGLRLAASGSLVRVWSLGDHLGAGLDLRWRFHSGEKRSWQLGLATDMLRRADPGTYPMTGALELPVLLCSRMGVHIGSALEKKLAPSFGLHITLLNGAATGLGADLGLEWKPLEHAGIDFGVRTDIWWQFLDGTPLPGLSAHIGVTHWL